LHLDVGLWLVNGASPLDAERSRERALSIV
jgi:hypothetical protein